MATRTKSTTEEALEKELQNVELENIVEQEESPKTLGNIKTLRPEQFKDPNEPEISPANQIGWKNIPIDSVPTQGLFYAQGTKLRIRAAAVAEIRHWSNMDENDGISIDESLNFILERCCQFEIPGKRAYIKDLKEIDRFYLIFAIRELTFKNGENKLYSELPISNTGEKRKIEITKDVLQYFKPDEKLMRFYDDKERCFNFTLKNGDSFKMYIPSIGITAFLKNYRLKKQQLNQTVDEDFEKYALFLFDDWRSLTDSVFENEHQKSFGWSIEKLSVFANVVDMIKTSINPAISTTVDGEEVVAPLSFQDGVTLKHIFVIHNFLDELY